jgi:glutaminyl-tRNA synthetase
LTREIYIERTDFSQNPPEDWTRLSPGAEVRLRHAYFHPLRRGRHRPGQRRVVELRCTYDPDSLGRPASAARKRSTAIQWVSAAHALPAEVRLYSKLFAVENPEADRGRQEPSKII